jgi:hypothetical protein
VQEPRCSGHQQARARRARRKRRQHEAFGCIAGHQKDFVDAARLADSIDPAGPLLDACGAPWQLVVHDRPAPPVEIQSF